MDNPYIETHPDVEQSMMVDYGQRKNVIENKQKALQHQKSYYHAGEIGCKAVYYTATCLSALNMHATVAAWAFEMPYVPLTLCGVFSHLSCACYANNCSEVYKDKKAAMWEELQNTSDEMALESANYEEEIDLLYPENLPRRVAYPTAQTGGRMPGALQSKIVNMYSNASFVSREVASIATEGVLGICTRASSAVGAVLNRRNAGGHHHRD